MVAKRERDRHYENQLDQNASRPRLPVTSDWVTLSKKLNTPDFGLLRRYGFLSDDPAQPFPNLFILFCALTPAHYSYLDMVLPKDYPIVSFPRESWRPNLTIRFIVDGQASYAMAGEYRNGEINFDHSPGQADIFLKVITAHDLEVGFGDKNDTLSFKFSGAMTKVFKEFAVKGNANDSFGNISMFSTDSVVQNCLSRSAKAAPIAIGTSEQRVPLVEDGGTFVAPVVINDAITLNFAIDSGAADVSIPIDVFTTLIRAGTVTRSDITGSEVFVTATGEKTTLPTFRIRSLKIGGTVIHDVAASVGPIQGTLLLGQSFLRNFKSWSIDNSTHELVLR